MRGRRRAPRFNWRPPPLAFRTGQRGPLRAALENTACLPAGGGRRRRCCCWVHYNLMRPLAHRTSFFFPAPVQHRLPVFFLPLSFFAPSISMLCVFDQAPLSSPCPSLGAASPHARRFFGGTQQLLVVSTPSRAGGDRCVFALCDEQTSRLACELLRRQPLVPLRRSPSSAPSSLGMSSAVVLPASSGPAGSSERCGPTAAANSPPSPKSRPRSCVAVHNRGRCCAKEANKKSAPEKCARVSQRVGN